MAYRNSFEVFGNLCADPEQVNTNSGPVTKIRVASTKRWKQGTERTPMEKTEFFNIDLWGQHGKYAYEYLRCGYSVSIKASLCTRTWIDSETQKPMSTIDVVVSDRQHEIQILHVPQSQKSTSIKQQAAPQKQQYTPPREQQAAPQQQQYTPPVEQQAAPQKQQFNPKQNANYARPPQQYGEVRSDDWNENRPFR